MLLAPDPLPLGDAILMLLKTTYAGEQVRSCDGCGRPHLGPGSEVYWVHPAGLVSATCCVVELAVTYTSLVAAFTRRWTPGMTAVANQAMDVPGATVRCPSASLSPAARAAVAEELAREGCRPGRSQLVLDLDGGEVRLGDLPVRDAAGRLL
jgi:hypothetical protein